MPEREKEQQIPKTLYTLLFSAYTDTLAVYIPIED